MKPKPIHVSAEQLRELLHYDPITGEWTWLRGEYAGKRAGTRRKDGRLLITIGRQTMYLASRLAWLYMTGDQPPDLVEHRDTDRSNDRWVNLREADKSKNGANRGKSATNTSGRKGVTWDKNRSMWRAQIRCQDQQTTIGYYDVLDDAASAYERKAIELFGEFARV